jgi:membrane-associated phospholipid phosphatase
VLLATAWHLDTQRMLRFLRARFQRGEYLGLHLTIGFLVSLAGLLLFIVIARQVVGQRALTRVDLSVYHWVRGNATLFGYGAWSVVTQLGGGVSILWIGTGMALLLALRRRFLLLAGWATALIGGGVLDYLLKRAFHRPRPEAAVDLLSTFSWSFPSGHSMGSFIAYGMLAYVLLVEFVPGRNARPWVIAACTAMVLAVGVSRLYLGVHYLSDVLGGFCAGGLWLTACISGLEVARRLPVKVSPPDR